MADRLVAQMFRDLVARAGGVDAMAALLEARTGVGHKGTVSKMMSGQLAVSCAAVFAVEDMVGDHPITRWRWEAIGGPRPSPAADLVEAVAEMVTATGRAHAALLRALSDRSDGGSSVTAAEADPIRSQLAAVRSMLARIDGALAAESASFAGLALVERGMPG